ncbi:global transcription factor group B1 [Actinidia rufa]|uniref:Global transcription factor group B1 n=1 Tax=Actinidia rufa TaxID=165716 RepID=A0A7J0H5W0_9ERIC|nr:global transcription factor group B1 [Actinidia rufa]
MNVQKLDKEECLSILRDPEQHEADIENQNKPDQQPTIRWHKRMDELKGAKETLEEMASNFTCAVFETPQVMLKGQINACHSSDLFHAAVEISCEPCVWKHVRSIFTDNAVVSTSPTPNGNTVIDTFHQFAGDAFHGFLLSSLEKEARSLLTSRAKNWLLMEYGNLLWDKVSLVPYQQKENDVSSGEEAELRIIACCWVPGKSTTNFV